MAYSKQNNVAGTDLILIKMSRADVFLFASAFGVDWFIS
jgi:hypothetical protein